MSTTAASSSSASSSSSTALTTTTTPAFETIEMYDQAVEIMQHKPLNAAELFMQVIQMSLGPEGEATSSRDDFRNKYSRMKEEAVYNLGRIYAQLGDAQRLKQLMIDLRPYFITVSKSRSAKIVRTLIDEIGKMPNSQDLLVELCQDAIDWCIAEKRSFLRQRIQARLAGLYCELGRFKESLATIRKLVREVKKFDDKQLMVEIELIETKVYFLLQNYPKAKGALTAARSNANGFYCPPPMQGQIDLLAGILCLTEGDAKTAFSYFYEAFESFSTAGDKVQATQAMKQMLLSKIMAQQASDVYAIVTSKAGLKYAGVELEAMRAVADACRAKDIHQLGAVLEKYKEQLQDDPVVHTQLSSLHDRLLTENIQKVLLPYSRVQISHVAELIKLPRDDVEAKLSQMVLDSVLPGVLDQGTDDLIIFDKPGNTPILTTSLDLLKELDGCVDRLNKKASRLASM